MCCVAIQIGICRGCANTQPPVLANQADREAGSRRSRPGDGDRNHLQCFVGGGAARIVVMLGSAVARTFGALEPGIFVLLHMFWGIGLALYGIYIALFAYRIFFFAVVPDDLTPILWVVMGAAAISTNAGADLILNGSGVAFLTSMRPVVGGVTLIMWAWATWWIPLLVLFGIWKHLLRRVPLAYTPMLWGLVFPLGMYSLASFRLALAADFPALRLVSH